MTGPGHVGVHLIQVPYDSGAKDARMGRGPGHLLAVCGVVGPVVGAIHGRVLVGMLGGSALASPAA